MAFDVLNLEDSFYISVKAALDKFSCSKFNMELYALVFDCDSDSGQICLRYSNMAHFKNMLKSYEQYKYMFAPYGKYGLRGYKYSVGEFLFIDFEYSVYVNHFLESYYFYKNGEYWGDGEPIQAIDATYEAIWRSMILKCIKRLQSEYSLLNTTDDFVIFMCDHDQSDEDSEAWLKWTVDTKLFNKLLKESFLNDI